MGAVVVASLLVASPTTAADRGRDPLVQPFASSSIWNTPLGSDANYQPTYLQVEPRVTLDPNYVVATGTDYDTYALGSPDGPSYTSSGVTFGGRCSGTSDFGPILFPTDFMLGDATLSPQFSTPNNATAVVYPDGRTIAQLQPGARCRAGSNPHGYRATESDLYDDGTYGSHFGSGLSSIGGQIGVGEIAGPAPIRHALQLELWGAKYLTYDAADSTPGFRWPADRHDYVAPDRVNGYCTQDPCSSSPDPQMQMGALLAIPPSTTAASLNITNPAAKKIFQALKDFGGYIVDDTAWSTAQIGIDSRAESEVDITDPAWTADVTRIFAALNVITNSDAEHIGGGGEPRVAPVAELAKPTTKAAKALKLKDARASASDGSLSAQRANDGRESSGWSAGVPLANGQWFALDLLKPRDFNRVSLNSDAFAFGYAQDYDVQVSDDGSAWTTITHGSGARTSVITFPVQHKRFVRVFSNGSGIDPAHQSWSIGEFELFNAPGISFGTPAPLPTPTPTPEPEPAAYDESFDGAAPGWDTGASGTIASGRLELLNFGGDARAVLTGHEFGGAGNPYALHAEVSTIAGDNSNKARIFFAAAADGSEYAVQIGGGASGSVELLERTPGGDTVIATATAPYSIGASTEITIAVAADGRTTVTGTSGGLSTVLIEATPTATRAGLIGMETLYSQLAIYRVRVTIP
ncbi:discoidin domain-containing protein [Cryobacterium sp. TMT2-15-1]|uniref:discoidin domain-containing protein n=1 Tax=Cryobacterium sp. TMT2-15-1 TaxID=1259246 RepID=UPI00141ACAA9|nr:discoidin domain-containing protein [Cryobacterium sp. TMT2-15-1]